jgi:hypothetical protein
MPAPHPPEFRRRAIDLVDTAASWAGAMAPGWNARRIVWVIVAADLVTMPQSRTAAHGGPLESTLTLPVEVPRVARRIRIDTPDAE